MKYTTPEYKIEIIETQDVITASGSATVDATDTATNVLANIDDILNQLIMNK